MLIAIYSYYIQMLENTEINFMKKFPLSIIFLTITFSLFAERFTVGGITFCTNLYEDDYGGIKKEIPVGEAIVCELPSRQKRVKIPSKVEHEGKSYKVREIFYASGVSIYKYGRDLEAVEIEEGIKKIGAFAFFQCDRLRIIRIPSTCTEIDLEFGLPKTDSSGNHFYCDLEAVIVASKNPKYYSKDGILYDKKTDKVLFIPHSHKSKSNTSK